MDALLADGTFTPRAATRNPDSDASKKLKDRGIEIVQADLSDKESLKSAIAGSEGVFGVGYCSSFYIIRARITTDDSGYSLRPKQTRERDRTG